MIDPKVVVDEFKTEYMKMTEEERLDYLNRMGFVFEEVIPMIPSELMSFDEFETKLGITMDAYPSNIFPPTIYPPTTFDIFNWKVFQAWLDYLEMMGISYEEADVEETTQEDIDDGIFEQFKTKFDNMTEEERFDYLDRMGFVFSKKEQTDEPTKLSSDDCTLSRIKKEK